VKKFAIPGVVVLFIVVVVLVAVFCSEEVASSAPGEAAISACVDCHTDIELLEQVAEVVEEEPVESEGEG
jgi:hypothetical protein